MIKCTIDRYKEIGKLFYILMNFLFCSKDVQDLSYVGPVVAADQLIKYLKDFGYNNDVSILDLGCGTGLVGEQLYKHGYKNIDGLDCCQELLKVAETKSVYR